MLIAIGSILLLVAAVFGLIILINAFKESVGQGLLCMFVPLYIFFYAFAKYRSPKKPIVVGGWLGAMTIGIVLQVVGVVGAVNDTAQALESELANGNWAAASAPAPAANAPARVMRCDLSQQPGRICNQYALGDLMNEEAARQHCDLVQMMTPEGERTPLAEGPCPTAGAIGKCEQRFTGTTNVFYSDPDPSIDNDAALTANEQLCTGTFTRLGG